MKTKVSDLQCKRILTFLSFFCLVSISALCLHVTIFQRANSQETSPTTTDSGLIADGSFSSNNDNNTNSNALEALGITLGNITYEFTDINDGLENDTEIFIITDVQPLSPRSEGAEIIGKNNLTQIDEKEVMLPGDVLVKIDDFLIEHINNMTSVFEEKKPGDTINLTVIRNASLENVTLTLAAEDFLPEFIEGFSGMYVNPEAGLQMSLPQGWVGFQSRGTVGFAIAGPNIVNISDILSENISISISVTDFPFVQNISSQINRSSLSAPLEDIQQIIEIECSTLSESFGTLNNTISTLDSINECSILGNYSKSRSVALATEEKLITITFNANSPELYEANSEKFNQSLATLDVDNPIDIRILFTDLSGAGNNNQTATGPVNDFNSTASSTG